MNEPAIVQPPCEGGGVADCDPGFHNPPGQMCICVPDIPGQPPEVQPVPTLETWALIGLMVIICIVALNWIWRRKWA